MTTLFQDSQSISFSLNLKAHASLCLSLSLSWPLRYPIHASCMHICTRRLGSAWSHYHINMTELRCRLNSLAFAALGRSPHESDVIGWVTLPQKRQQHLLAFMRTIFPCSRWIYSSRNSTSTIPEWMSNFSSSVYWLVDSPAERLDNNALNAWINRPWIWVHGEHSGADWGSLWSI